MLLARANLGYRVAGGNMQLQKIALTLATSLAKL